MKKLIVIVLSLLMLGTALTGCVSKGQSSTDKDKLSIVTTIFPEYDWVREITKGNDDVEITLLLDNSVDLHSFQPTEDDIIKVSSCDMFIYVGGESDEWVEDALAEATNKDMVVINLIDVLGDSVKEEELDLLDKEYEATINAATVKTVLFGDRFPFRYLADDYGLDYYAAFVGCSAETEASFETITFLAKKVDELGLNTILQIESADGKIAETIKNNTTDKAQKILTMNSIQSTTSKDIANGTTYLSAMKDNLDVLKQALK